MSESARDFEGDESDLKEVLIETLKRDGKLRRIQELITTEVYAAFYQQNAKRPPEVPTSVESFLDTENGVHLISMVVDLLESLGLQHTKNILIHEANLDSIHLKNRLELKRIFPWLTPIIPAWQGDNEEIVALSQAVVFKNDSVSRCSPDGVPLNASSPSNPVQPTQADGSLQNQVPEHSCADILLHSILGSKVNAASSSPADVAVSSVSSLARGGEEPTSKGPSVLTTAPAVTQAVDYLPAGSDALSNYNSTACPAAVPHNTQLIASLVDSRRGQDSHPSSVNDDEKYSDDSFPSETHNTPNPWVSEAIEDAAPPTEDDVSESVGCLNVLSPEVPFPRNEPSSGQDTGRSLDGCFSSSNYNKGPTTSCRPSNGSQARYATNEGDSDIDSEVR
uniref:Uncharacterized protein n=1 Tax=Schistocephalus solidus TaxID=70667 RepID=A0A0X3P8X0_SCHSO